MRTRWWASTASRPPSPVPSPRTPTRWSTRWTRPTSSAVLADLARWREQRDGAAVLRRAGPAEGRRGRRRAPDVNLMSATLACARAGVTTGEWSFALREVFGEYRAPTGVGGAPVAAGGPGGELAAVREAVRATAGRDRGRPAAPAARQARPGRALQRCRADRHPGPRRRVRGDLPGHPAHSGADRGGRDRRGRALRGVVDPVRRARRTGARRAAPAAARPGRGISRWWSAGSSRRPTPQTLRALGVAAVFTPRDFGITAIIGRIVDEIRRARGLPRGRTGRQRRQSKGDTT